MNPEEYLETSRELTSKLVRIYRTHMMESLDQSIEDKTANAKKTGKEIRDVISDTVSKMSDADIKEALVNTLFHEFGARIGRMLEQTLAHAFIEGKNPEEALNEMFDKTDTFIVSYQPFTVEGV